MRDKEFETLIDLYLKDQLSMEEKFKVEEWLRHITDESAFGNLTETEKDASQSKTYADLMNRIGPVGSPKRTSVIIRMRLWLKVASCFVLLGIAVFAFSNQLKDIFNIQRYTSVANSAGHITKSILSDGTIVWLKGNSKLSYPVKFQGNLRNVDLEGEALFEVAKDAAHPFIIHCGVLTTRVLGTSFNIKRTSNKIEVNVLTGRVFLSSANAAAVTLRPHQKGTFSEVKKTIIQETHPVVEVASLTRGTEYDMFFNDATIGEVLHRIGKKFEVKINYKALRPNNTRITADFTDQSLVNTMNMMCEALNLEFAIKQGAVTITDNPTN
ncbi:FecR family protein [Mucilaginibacter sabulilitoris]|uniref:FecR family protein n=1 Tax=Mucilaginibacter sabulilitoris TaxID=1173583 RepID=A0ABZ0TV09_9SPHI|nr:FecR family protein [Mucilaginibacter sabulilitoris]WPU95285.1 FecR family protein [Mucilaginibacter sabulilitoris]